MSVFVEYIILSRTTLLSIERGFELKLTGQKYFLFIFFFYIYTVYI